MTALLVVAAILTAGATAALRRDLTRATTWTYDAPRAWSVNGHGAIRTDEARHAARRHHWA